VYSFDFDVSGNSARRAFRGSALSELLYRFYPLCVNGFEQKAVKISKTPTKHLHF